MTLQSEDMGKLVAGKSVLWHRKRGLVTAWHQPEQPGGVGYLLNGGYHIEHFGMFTLIGTLTPDGWIEGEWAENPVPGMDVETRIGQRMHTQGDSGIATWDRVTAFRPAHREAQPETDGGGEGVDLQQALRRVEKWLLHEAEPGTLNAIPMLTGVRAALASKGV